MFLFLAKLKSKLYEEQIQDIEFFTLMIGLLQNMIQPNAKTLDISCLKN
jgi:hypothetical protein